MFIATCNNHARVRESWIDVVFGTWGKGTDYDDHITLDCRSPPSDWQLQR
ncbi:hypothetical protein Acsp02_85540 [Actinoplanes sp. NBRC 103695]|nr:hypothetical protein Acsp02_85540 [Actinoplanes sp. NBRC 103695]